MKLAGWITRIYHNQTHNDSVTSAWTMLRKELNVGAHVDLCNATKILHNQKLNKTTFAMTWRWVIIKALFYILSNLVFVLQRQVTSA